MSQRDLSLPGPHDERQSRDEIAAEIADHLASSAAELTKGGVAAEEAHAAARKKFGDVTQITKACYWIQNGETIMLRWTLVSLGAVLCILLGLSVLGNWRSQSQLADEVGKLSAELKALAAAKQAPPPAPQPPEITGVIYTESKDKPLANAKVAILRADGTVARRIACDDKGQYQSGPLEAGDYSVTTPLQNAPEIYARRIVQSQPIFLHGGGNVSIDLDAAYHVGGLKVSIDRDLPRVRKDGSYLVMSLVNVFAVRSRQRGYIWTAREDSPNRWPIYCYPELLQSNSSSRSAWGADIEGISPVSDTFLLKQGDERILGDRGSKIAGIFPVEDAEIEATLLIGVLPLDEKGEILVPIGEYQQILGRFPDLPKISYGTDQNAKTRTIAIPLIEKKADGDLWRELIGRQLWLSKLKGFTTVTPIYVSPASQPRQSAPIHEGEFTKILVEIPEGIEDDVEKMIESTPNADEFAKLHFSGFFRRPLKFRVVGNEAMTK